MSDVLFEEVAPGLYCATGGTIVFQAVGRMWRFLSRNPATKVRQQLSRPRRSMSRREKTENHISRRERLRVGRPGFYYDGTRYMHRRIRWQVVKREV